MTAAVVPAGCEPRYFSPPDVLYDATSWMAAMNILGGSVVVRPPRRRAPWMVDGS